MKKVLFFNTSNSDTSINGQLLQHVATLMPQYNTHIFSIKNFPLPFFSEDAEKLGFPKSLEAFFSELDCHDAYVFSCAEHNGGVTAEFKNLFDWATRYRRDDRKIFSGKPLLVFSASPGSRGGKNAAKWFSEMAGYQGADIVAVRSIGSVQKPFSKDKIDQIAQQSIQDAVFQFCQHLDQPDLEQQKIKAKAPLTLINTFYPKPGKLMELAQLQQKETAKLGIEAERHGWLGNEIYRAEDSESLVIVTRFASKADKEAWQQTSAFKAHLELISPLLERVESRVFHLLSKN